MPDRHSLLSSLAILGACWLWFAAPAAAEIIDRVAANVNGEVITLSQFQQEAAPMLAQIAGQAPPAEAAAAISAAQRQILNDLVDRLLVDQYARKRGITVGEAEVDQALAQVMAENKRTEEQLKRDLVRMGLTLARYRDSLRAQVLQSRLLGSEVRAKVVITEERMREYYQNNYANQAREAAYHILQMGFAWRPGDDGGKQEAARRAQAAREQIMAGADFRATAKRLSDLPSGPDGGDIGVFSRDELSGDMRAAILALKPGEISPLIETPVGHQFFQLLSDQGDVKSRQPFEAVKDEIREKLYRQALEAQFEKWVTTLRNDAYIKIML